MIEDIKQCSVVEKNRQIKYLKRTPVAKISELIESGCLKLKKGKVTSLSDIGRLKTEFGELGGIKPLATNGEIKFMVAELVPALENNPIVDDGGLLEDIKAIAKSERNNEIEFNVTILVNGNELIIKDGNKRTVAYYENRKANTDIQISYPVYIVYQL